MTANLNGTSVEIEGVIEYSHVAQIKLRRDIVELEPRRLDPEKTSKEFENLIKNVGMKGGTLDLANMILNNRR